MASTVAWSTYSASGLVYPSSKLQSPDPVCYARPSTPPRMLSFAPYTLPEPQSPQRIPARFFASPKIDTAAEDADVLASIRSRAFGTRAAPHAPVPAPPPAPSLNSSQSIPRLREALLSLDSKMASLMSQRAALESRLEQAVRLQSPVLRLPSELLAHIFVVGVRHAESEDALMVSTLMQVCRYWADVALGTPELWASVVVSTHTHHSLERARRRLARSKSAPLDVAITFAPRLEHAGGVTEAVCHAMDLIRPALWRTRSLRLSVPNRPQAHAALLRCREDAPLLETLAVRVFHSMQDDHYSSAPLPLFNGRTPRLASVSFESFNFAWDLPIVSGLRVLQLSGYWNGCAPAVETVLAMLRACPRLEELALRNMSDIDPAPLPAQLDREWACVKPISLPRLARASFYYSGKLRTRLVLSQVSLPALADLELCYLDDVSPLLSDLKQQSVMSLPLRRLRIESSFFSELKFEALLHRLPRLATLQLVDCEDASSNLFRRLCTPIAPHMWVCPQLESLSLENCTNVDWDALRLFVEARLTARPAHTHTQTQALALRPRQRPTYSSASYACARPANPAAGGMQRLRAIDVTRCHQISKEGVQWLRMYVADVRCDSPSGPWGEPALP